MTTKVALEAVPVSPANDAVIQQNDELLKIVDQQQKTIQELQRALLKMTADRDRLLSLHKSVTPASRDTLIVTSDCESGQSPETTPDVTTVADDSEPVRSSPILPPRSPYRQLREASVDADSVRRPSQPTQDSHQRSMTPPVPPPHRIQTVKDPMWPTEPNVSNTRNGSAPLSPTGSTLISLPVTAIMDKDAALFAKYQESVMSRETASPLPSPFPMTPSLDGAKHLNNTPCTSVPLEGANQYPSGPTKESYKTHPDFPSDDEGMAGDHDGCDPIFVDTSVPPVEGQSPVWSVSHKSPQTSPHTALPRPIPKPNGSIDTLSGSLAGIGIKVLGSNISLNKKGKDVLSFNISVRKSMDYAEKTREDGLTAVKELWRIQKFYSDFLGLDTQLKAQGRPKAGKIGKLPDKALFATHAPNKADQRKVAIERYLQHAIDLPLTDTSPLCEFLSTNKIQVDMDEISPSSGVIQGYLTKKEKGWHGWKTRYFALEGTHLCYFEHKGGPLLGSINLKESRVCFPKPEAQSQALNEARHAFIIFETRKASQHDMQRHILCASSDAERDKWAEKLVDVIHAITTADNEEKTKENKPAEITPPLLSPLPTRARRASKDETISTPNPARESSLNHARMAGVLPVSRHHPHRSNSDTSINPNESTLSDTTTYLTPAVGSNHLPALRQRSSLDYAFLQRRPMYPGNDNASTTPSKASHYAERSSSKSSMESLSVAVTPSNTPPSATRSLTDDDSNQDESRRNKGKPNRRTFWAKKIFTSSSGDGATGITSGLGMTGNGIRGFLSRSSSDSMDQSLTAFSNPRRQKASSQEKTTSGKNRVFGVPLEDAIRACRISEKCELPAVVYRCIEYLEAKNATQEEGLYRLSGSAVKIKSLKQKFDQAGDYNLLESGEYHDIHAVAGLLKLWLRELPHNVLTTELLKEFLPVIDLVERDERVNELGRLVSMLPLANYTLLRTLCAHLIRVIQYSEITKMNVRNVGIIFSPTLRVPACIFTLFLTEFEYIFWTNDVTFQSPSFCQEDDDDGTYPSQTIPSYSPLSANASESCYNLHPTQPLPLQSEAAAGPQPSNAAPDTPLSEQRPQPVMNRVRRVLRDDHGRSNRNSVHYSDGAPSSLMGLENSLKGNAVIGDDEDEVEDLELNPLDDEDLTLTDDENVSCYTDPTDTSGHFTTSPQLLVMK